MFSGQKNTEEESNDEEEEEEDGSGGSGGVNQYLPLVMQVVEELLEKSLQLQRDIRSIALELAQLQDGLEQEVTEFCNLVDRGSNEQGLVELTMNMSSLIAGATNTFNGNNNDRKKKIYNKDDESSF